MGSNSPGDINNPGPYPTLSNPRHYVTVDCESPCARITPHSHFKVSRAIVSQGELSCTGENRGFV